MTSERTDFGTIRYKSERFNRDWKEFQANAHFFEDDDPRIELVKDRFGNDIWIVGYTDPIVFNVGHGDSVKAHIIGIDAKYNSVIIFDEWLLG